MTKYKLEILRSTKNKEFFWRITHRNGNEICRSSETYKRKIDCKNALKRLMVSIAVGEYSAASD